MNQPTSKLDLIVRELCTESIPPQDQIRLERRFAEFEARMAGGTITITRRPVMTRRAFQCAATASLAAIGASVLTIWNWSAPPAWAQVAATVESAPWIHLMGASPDGTSMDFWISIPRGIYAAKFGDTVHALHASRTGNTRLSWRSSTGTVQKSSFRAPPGELGYLDRLLSSFGAGRVSLEVPGPDRILDQSRRGVTREGQNRWQYTFTLEAFDGGHADTYIVVFEVDPTTRRPVSWIRRAPDGSREIRFAIDYPETGPEDIYALGVPRTAKVVE
jgi:hypothetical protein